MTSPTPEESREWQLEWQLGQAEHALRTPGRQASCTKSYGLYQQALALWEADRSTMRNELRVRAGMVYGLSLVYRRKPGWQEAIIPFVINPSWNILAPEPANDHTRRLYALSLVNEAIARLHDSEPSVSHFAWEAATSAIAYFEELGNPTLNKWRAIALLVIAYMAPEYLKNPAQESERHANLALTYLDTSSEPELHQFALRLLGVGDGLVPGSGWLGTNFRRRSAFFGVDSLYHFEV